MSNSSPFGKSSSSPFGSASVFGQTNNPGSNPFTPKPFGSTTPFGAQTGGSIFGGTSTGVFGATQSSSPSASTPVFGTSSSPAFGSTTPAFGTSMSSFGGFSTFAGFAFSTTQSSPLRSAFFESSTPFGQPSQPAFGATSTPAFGSTGAPSFGSSSSPGFGSTSSTPGFRFGSTSSTPGFGFGSTSSTPGFRFGSTSSTPGFGFGSSSTPGFGFGSTSSTPGFRFGSSSTPGFGSTSSTPGFGSTGTTFGVSSAPGFGSTAFGASSSPIDVPGISGTSPFVAPSTSAFGGSSTPVFGSTSTSAFGSSSTCSFNSGFSPAFVQSTSAFTSSPSGTSTSPFTAQSSPFDLPGFTRTVYKRDHALISPESHMFSSLPEWNNTLGAYLITPAMGSHFVMYLAKMEGDSKSGLPPKDVERFVFMLEGEVTLIGLSGISHNLKVDSYAYLPPSLEQFLVSDAPATLVVFERRYAYLGNDIPLQTTGSTDEQPLIETPGEVFKLRELLPTSMAYDFNIHIMDFQPGEFLNAKEVHYNQQGLLLLEGQGVYRLGDSWYPVQAGDAIWMAPFVPQWYAALGKTRTRYLLYKEVNRFPI